MGVSESVQPVSVKKQNPAFLIICLLHGRGSRRWFLQAVMCSQWREVRVWGKSLLLFLLPKEGYKHDQHEPQKKGCGSGYVFTFCFSHLILKHFCVHSL